MGDVFVTMLAYRTFFPNCAWRANVVNEVALLAAPHNKTAVEMADFQEAISRIVAGLEKK